MHGSIGKIFAFSEHDICCAMQLLYDIRQKVALIQLRSGSQYVYDLLEKSRISGQQKKQLLSSNLLHTKNNNTQPLVCNVRQRVFHLITQGIPTTSEIFIRFCNKYECQNRNITYSTPENLFVQLQKYKQYSRKPKHLEFNVRFNSRICQHLSTGFR